MRFPHRHYRDRLLPRPGLDNVGARDRFISRGRIINCVPAELLNCREIVGTKRSRGDERDARRDYRIADIAESCRSRRKGGTRSAGLSTERGIMERKLRRVYDGRRSFRIARTHATLRSVTVTAEFLDVCDSAFFMYCRG